MTMDSKILEGTTSPLTIQLATRDYFDRRIETLKDSSPIDFNSNRLSPFDITMNGISHWESSPPYAFSLPLMLNPSTMSQAVTQFTCDYVFEVSGLAPTVTALQLCTIFSQYGQVIAFRLHTNIIGSISLCSGTATLRLYGSIQLRDYALATLNGAHVPQLEGPIFVSLL